MDASSEALQNARVHVAPRAPVPSGKTEAAAVTETHVADLDKVKHVLMTSGQLPLRHSFFISHRQDNAGDVAAILSLKLSNLTDLPCWCDDGDHGGYHNGDGVEPRRAASSDSVLT